MCLIGYSDTIKKASFILIYRGIFMREKFSYNEFLDLIEKNEVVQFKDGSFVLDVNVSSNGETVWLTLDQMSRLFNKN